MPPGPKPLYEGEEFDFSDLPSPLAISSTAWELLLNSVIWSSARFFGLVGFSEASLPFLFAGVFIAAIVGAIIVLGRNLIRYAWYLWVQQSRNGEEDPQAKRRAKRSTKLPSVYTGIALPLGIALGLLNLAFAVIPAMLDRSMNRVLRINGTVTKETLDFHNSLDFIGDLHADSLMWTHRGSFLEPALPSFAQVSLPLLRKGNVALQVLSSVTRTPVGMNMHSNSNDTRDNIDLLTFIQGWEQDTYSGEERYTKRQQKYADLLGLAVKYSGGKLLWIKNKADLEKLVEQRQKDRSVTAALLSIEGSSLCLPELLGPAECANKLFDMGVRMVGLTHFIDLPVGASATGTAANGLSDYGRAFVRRLFELNILIDFAHVHTTTILDVLKMHDLLPTPKPPLVVSHTGFRAICNHSRNVADELGDEMVQRGTLLGVAFFPQAICGDKIEDVVDGFRYAVDRWGIDNVALGSDYDGGLQ